MSVAVFVCVLVVAFVIDRLTKLLALTYLSDGRIVEIVPHVLSLHLIFNPGASLGMGASATWVISLISMVCTAALALAGLLTRSVRWAACLAFACAGAAGNLVDRVIYATGFLNGRVVDFLDYGWSIGNVADVWLVAAAVALVLLILSAAPFDARWRPASRRTADSDGGRGDASRPDVKEHDQ